MTELVGIYGAGGMGRELAPLVTLANSAYEVVFIDDAPTADSVNGRSVLTLEQFVARPAERRFAVLGVGDSRLREKLYTRYRGAGVESFSLSHPTVVILEGVEIGEGAVLCNFVTVTANVRIGRCFQANIYSYVAHDCVIGDFVTFAPGVNCNGNVHIHDHAYIGSGAVLRQGTPDKPLVIGAGAIVGMGAVVTKDVPPGVTVVGNPARVLEKG